MKMCYVLVLFVVLFIFAAVGCGPPATPEATATPTVHPGKALISSKCIACHDLNRLQTAKHDRDGWESTVNRMVLNGAQLNDDQVEIVVDYLSLAFPVE